jgi:tRNA pseudouridine55 synthase
VISGILLLDKPSGPTSHDMVAQVRRGAGLRQVGHSGTLDPLASGLLVLCLGPATRLSEYLLNKDKRYEARLLLGQTTNTYDTQGEVTARSDLLPTEEQFLAALGPFRGTIAQRPPAFSAIKMNGRKAYELARRGEEVDLASRPVDILSLDLTAWEPPECSLSVHCSAGTYIRSLAHDLGQSLGCGACLSALRRVASGAFGVEQAVSLADLQAAFGAGDWQRYLLPADSALSDWPAVSCSPAESQRLRQGQAVRGAAADQTWARGYDASGQFFAILRADPAGGLWRPHKILSDG